MEKFNLIQILEAVNGKITQEGRNELINTSIKVCINSMEAVQNSLFIPLIGEKQDGHKYISDAIKNGAKYIIYSNDTINFEETVTYIKVKDTLKALKDLAVSYRASKKVKVVGITGSVGKTTTKDMVASVLAQKYNVTKTYENQNSETGVPLTILNIKEKDDICVCEMGMDHIGEIAESSKIAMPDVTCITNIGISHMEILKTQENILKAKLEIVKYQRKYGEVVLNADDDILNKVNNKTEQFLEDKKIYYVGRKKGCYTASVENIDVENMSIQVNVKDNDNTIIDVNIEGISQHLVYSVIYAYTVGKIFELNEDEIKQGLEKYVATALRMQIENLKCARTVICDTYNACPESMKSAIDATLRYDKTKYFILGDMLELGMNTVEEHRKIASYILEKSDDKVKYIWFIGENMKAAYDKYIKEKDNAKYVENKDKLGDIDLEENSVVLLKASRRFKFETISKKIIEKYSK